MLIAEQTHCLGPHRGQETPGDAGRRREHLIGVTFDIEVDGELQSDALLHSFLQSWDFLSGEFVPVKEEDAVFPVPAQR